MKRLAALLICLISLVPSLAQDAPPVITPENAISLQMLESAGSALPVGVQFSPDSRYILAITTDETFVYSVEDPDAAPRIFPYSQFAFDDHGNLVIGNERWNLDTGQSIGIPPSLKVVREAADDPAVIEVVKPGGETIRVETEIVKPVSRMAVNDNYTVLAVASEEEWIYHTRLTVYLYALPTGHLIAALPGTSGFPIYRLHFTHGGYSELLLVETMDTSPMSLSEVALIQLPYGTDEEQYGGTIWGGVRFSPDGKFAYALEDRIVYGTGSVIDTIPYSGQLETLIIGDRGIASVTADGFRAALFGEDGRIGDFVEYEAYSGFSIEPRFAGEHIFFTVQDALWIWDVASPDAEPHMIEIERGMHNFTLSPELERYSYLDQDNRRFVRETSTNELLAELPPGAIVSPDWSRAAYWDGKLLTVDDFADEQDYLHVNPRHVGRVADFENGYAAFIDEMLQVVDVDSADGHTDTVTIEGLFEGAHFFNNGACIVTFAPASDESLQTRIHRLDADSDCASQEYLTPITNLSAFITPEGRYLATFDFYCETLMGYGLPSANIYPLYGQPSGELPNILQALSACGPNAFAFSADESAIYFADGLLWRGHFSEDGTLDQSKNVERLLRYSSDELNDEQTEYSYARIVGVFLSPDEEKIAVYVEDSNGADWVQERYIEIFALDDLGPGVTRRDVRPLRTIPDATVATFSPDSSYVVTNKGLCSVEFSNQTPAVNGTISAFSPDSQILATVQAGYVTLWRVPQPSAINFPLAQYKIGGVRELAFSEDGTRLYVIRAGEVQVWGVTP